MAISPGGRSSNDGPVVACFVVRHPLSFEEEACRGPSRRDLESPARTHPLMLGPAQAPTS